MAKDNDKRLKNNTSIITRNIYYVLFWVRRYKKLTNVF